MGRMFLGLVQTNFYDAYLFHASTEVADLSLCRRFIKEAGIISVLGTLQRQDDVIMIVPPAEPISTGFQWKRCLFPIQIQGLMLLGDKNPDDEVVIA